MRKISIVALRRERNKELETAALLRARRRELGQDQPEFEAPTPRTLPPANGRYDLSPDEEEYSFDVILTPDQLRAIREHVENSQGESSRDNGNPGAADGPRSASVIFRFNITLPQLGKTLTPDDVCTILNISRKTLYRYVKSDKINCFRIGSQLRFLKQDLYRFLETCKVKNEVNY